MRNQASAEPSSTSSGSPAGTISGSGAIVKKSDFSGLTCWRTRMDSGPSVSAGARPK